jgi:hypothetical protein
MYRYKIGVIVLTGVFFVCAEKNVFFNFSAKTDWSLRLQRHDENEEQNDRRRYMRK